jgi:hypothetical protein
VDFVEGVSHLGMLREPLPDVPRGRLAQVVKQLPPTHPGSGDEVIHLLLGESLATELDQEFPFDHILECLVVNIPQLLH